MAKKSESATVERLTVAVPRKVYASTAEISLLYGLSCSYLKKLRHVRQGPPYVKLGKLVLYPLAEFSEWFASVAESHEADPAF